MLTSLGEPLELRSNESSSQVRTHKRIHRTKECIKQAMVLLSMVLALKLNDLRGSFNLAQPMRLKNDGVV